MPVVTPYHDSLQTNAFSLSQGNSSENQPQRLPEGKPHQAYAKIAKPGESNEEDEESEHTGISSEQMKGIEDSGVDIAGPSSRYEDNDGTMKIVNFPRDDSEGDND